MNKAFAVPLLKLALAALEREVPNVDLARGVLRDVVGDGRADAALRVPDAGEKTEARTRHAVTIKRAAVLLSLCTKTVRQKIARGEIPAIGAGRATRVLMPDAIEALARHDGASADPMDAIAEEAVTHVRNRTRPRGRRAVS